MNTRTRHRVSWLGLYPFFSLGITSCGPDSLPTVPPEGSRASPLYVAAARRLRSCGFAVLISAAKTAVGAVLLSMAVSIDLPKDHRVLSVSLSSDDLGLLLIGGIVLVIARVMEEAARLAEENAAFI